jgi:hypothetical protein
MALGPRPSASEPRFSRAAWIEAHEIENRFDGGALPEYGFPREPTKRSPESAARGAAKPVTPANTRVNVELIEPDGGPAQPETQAEPFLAIDPASDKRLLAGYQDQRFQDGGARGLSYSLSTNGGKSWTSGLVPALALTTEGPWERASDPWVAFGPDHRAYFVSLAFDETSPDNAVVVSTSEDGGASWGDPVTVHSPTGQDFDDKEAIVVDNGASSPFRGRVYVAWDMVRDRGGQPILFSWSDDGGSSFQPTATVAEGLNIGVVPLVAPNGVIHLFWVDYTPRDHGELRTAKSEDGGATWSSPAHVAEIFARGVDGMRTGEGLPSAAVDPRNGALYVTWQDSRFTGGTLDQIVLSRSTDGGETWSPAARISDGPNDAPAFTPAVAVDGVGRVAVLYDTQRDDPARLFGVDVYVTISSNGGKSFAKSRRVSQRTFDSRFAAFARGRFLGDYQGLVGGQRMFHALFVATLRPSGIQPAVMQPDVFTATIR